MLILGADWFPPPILKVNMKLVADTSLKKGLKSSKFLNTNECGEVYPYNRLNFLFKYGKPRKIADAVAFALIKKYDNVNLVNEKLKILSMKDDLDDMKSNDLRHLGTLYGIKVWSRKNIAVKADIREARRKGVEPKEE